MKKEYVLILLASLLVLSCATRKPYDQGTFNPKNESTELTATVFIDFSVKLSQVDDHSVDWSYTSGGTSNQVVKMIPGLHHFVASFGDGRRSSFFPQNFFAQLEGGKEYEMISVIEGSKVHFDVVEKKTRASAILDLAKLRGEKTDPVSVFIKYVLNPTMEETNHTVRLENQTMRVDLNPNMTYEQLDKTTGKKALGFHGFEMDFTMSKATMFLLETDPEKMTKDDFLNKSDYSSTAGIAWVPVACSNSQVTFKIVRPTADAGKTISFSIAELTSNQ